MTFPEMMQQAMTVKTKEEAEGVFAALEKATIDAGVDPADAKRRVRDELGYFAGYYDHLTRERVERLFECEHPHFGKIAEKGPPTDEEAFAMGLAIGEARRHANEIACRGLDRGSVSSREVIAYRHAHPDAWIAYPALLVEPAIDAFLQSLTTFAESARKKTAVVWVRLASGHLVRVVVEPVP